MKLLLASNFILISSCCEKLPVNDCEELSVGFAVLIPLICFERVFKGMRCIQTLAIAGFIALFGGSVSISPLQASSAIAIQQRALDYLNQGLAKAQQGRYQEAIAAYTQALQANPNYVAAYSNRGLAQREFGAFAAAIADFDQVIHLEPKNAIALYNRGETYAKLGALREALADLNQALQLQPTYPEAYNTRSVRLYEVRQASDGARGC